MADTLRACPFCACAVRIESNRDWHRLVGDHPDACVLWDAELAVPATDEQRAALVEDWNRRAEAPAQTAAPEEA